MISRVRSVFRSNRDNVSFASPPALECSRTKAGSVQISAFVPASHEDDLPTSALATLGASSVRPGDLTSWMESGVTLATLVGVRLAAHLDRKSASRLPRTALMVRGQRPEQRVDARPPAATEASRCRQLLALWRRLFACPRPRRAAVKAGISDSPSCSRTNGRCSTPKLA